MALVLLLRGVNVGGHRTFRPSRLAHDLRAFDVVNIGAAGTFVVRNPGSRANFRAALVRHLPVTTQIVFCEGRDLVRFERSGPFGPAPAEPGIVQFVSFLARRTTARLRFPITLPTTRDWLVRVQGSTGRIVFGEYRRHMRTIGCLGQLDQLFGVPVTTRSWVTVSAILRALNA
ncbi:MAG TPA: hypothetical protein VFZ21_04680 [Gemmatimonadaceae bacterium]|nr:hypothetical protein [Gemmatimonadaceae bacterium]